MDIATAALFAIFIWWFTTGAILYVDGLPTRTFDTTMASATVLLVPVLIGFGQTAGMATVEGAYYAFLCGLLCWAWQEIALYTGYLTGPCKTPAEPGLKGWPRFYKATLAILYHEIAILVMGVALIFMAWDAPNQIGLWTYLVLWIMRLSAKLNIFLGVRNPAAEFLPDHVAYLQSYFGTAPMNLLFPVSVTLSTIATVWIFHGAFAANATEFQLVGLTLIATLMALAVLEHWFLVIPLPATQLWAWGLASRTPHDNAAAASHAARCTARGNEIARTTSHDAATTRNAATDDKPRTTTPTTTLTKRQSDRITPVTVPALPATRGN